MSLEVERKFLIDPSVATLLVAEQLASMEIYEINQTYLIPPEGWDESRVRRMIGRRDRIECVHTLKRGLGLVREEQEVSISILEAAELAHTQHDASRGMIHKRRHAFCEQGLVFELDRYAIPRGLWVLEVELPSAGDPRATLPANELVPSWLPLLSEVTGEVAYSNAAIAARIADTA